MATPELRDLTGKLSRGEAGVEEVADELVASMKHIAEGNPFVIKAQQGSLADANIHTLLRIEDDGLASLMGPIAMGAVRFADRPSTADFIMDLVRLLRDDQQLAHAAAVACGTAPEEFPGQHLDAVPYGYVGFITWLFGYGDPAAIGLLAYLDTSLWHQSCVLLTPALERHPGAPQALVDYFGKYKERPDKTLGRAIEMAEEAVAAGSNLQHAAAAARLAGHFIAEIWQVSAEG